MEAGLAKVTSERADRQAELAEARSALERDNARLGHMARELEEVQASLAAHKDARHRSDAERRLEAAVEELKRAFPGVRGRLVELVTPTAKKYHLALTVSLGKHMDAVVVDSEAVAFECVAWLREHKVRPLTFIPLDTIARKEPPDALTAFLATPRGAARFRLARDVVRFDPELEPALLYALGATVVSDTLEDAKALRFERGLEAKVVSLDGCVVAKNGNMTGGASSADRDVASAGRWDEKQVAAAKATRDALLAEEETLRRRTGRARGGGGAAAGGAQSLVTLVEDLVGALATNATRVGVMTAERDRAAARIGELAAEGATADKNIAAARGELAATTARLAGRAAQLAALEAQVDGVADAVFGSFRARLGITGSLRDWETAVVARQEAQMQARRALTEGLTKLRAKADFTRSQDKARALAELEARLATAEAALAAAQGELAAAKAAAATAAGEEARLRGELEGLQTAQRALEGEREALARSRRGAAEGKAALAKQAAAHEAAVERLAGERHEELTRCQMAEIRLPRKPPAAAPGGGGKAKGRGKPAARGSRARRGRGASAAGGDAQAETDEEEEEEEEEQGGGRDVAMGSGVFSQDVTATSSQDAEGDLASATAAADARRAERIDFDALTLPASELEPGLPAAKVEERYHAFERQIGELEASLARQSPNMKAGAQLEEAERRLQETT